MSQGPDEPLFEVESNTAWLQGSILTGVAYGVVLVLFAMCIQTLWVRVRTRSTRTRNSIFLLLYVSVIFILATLLFVTNSAFVQTGFINDSSLLGPSVTLETRPWVPDNVASRVPIVLANWCANSLMLWRCTIIYMDCAARTKTLVVALPGVMHVGCLALGILWLVEVLSPVFGGFIDSTLLYFEATLVLNIVITALIVLRLLLHRHHVTKVVGPGHATYCTNIAAIIVESASLYSIFSLLFLITFGIDSPALYAFLQILGEVDVNVSNHDFRIGPG
ncbi:hypothetical protein BV22DRAFT_1195168 [Leucogyrophana mollusca]|uniref:Uncharacterized protein n=1 Tax=Leucogyrophana mollusca TaxID=85980 RepID=A0ACB8BLJ7_9AGAM|nr:hypothetical protein BV22DRAFT_1195168 [Leucogyrophana mollusca]